MFLVPLVIFSGVKFGFRKSCLCKRNDKYEVWERVLVELGKVKTDVHSKDMFAQL